MRQATEPPVFERLDAVEAIVGVLLQHSTEDDQILRRVAAVLVDVLHYAGAGIATTDGDGALSMRTFALDAELSKSVPALETALQRARDGRSPFLRLGDDQHAAGPIARALITAQPVIAGALGELLRPLLGEDDLSNQTRWPGIVVPFVLPDELSGCLLIISYSSAFSERELRMLQVVARHLALGLRNAQLYRRMEEQGRVAQMAFSSSAYLHSLRNQLGGLRTYLGLVKMLPHMTPEQRADVIGTGEKALQSLDRVAEILDHLHEPWRPQPQRETDVNDCLTAALVKVFRGLTPQQREQQHVTERGMHVRWRLADGLPPLRTSPDMLAEAFYIVIRNAVDSLHEKYGEDYPHGSHLTLESAQQADGRIVITIRDDGVGIPPGDRHRIFDLGWSTKKGEGMGFGLFWTRNYIEGLGGRLEVTSTPGEGATFRFFLPGAALE